ncbi:4-hydroxy-tetrahydrodipicolinate reductase [Fulvivirga sp. M361]|uniref:4-hydroxy-tetrahydrodipicolinate reductase n=1 Tax=Fulvivirga sp. M361 TaxID=2594266 RepID=UPI001179F72A|nr:4-hydroxy-tetrahydrodipicolinate reductase [Fulvivirga sp. M361]TRX62080.1 4-hydroxy-tetrahydrodipicolinate reductase [Fulvivirga sp. M361]
MKILLLGYGKMGKTIETLALSRSHLIADRIDQDNYTDLHQYNHTNVDVAIEFSQPDAAYNNIIYCLQHGIPIVSGTTGWLDRKDDIETLCKENNGAFFYSSNYSIGVNLFFKLNERLAELMENTTEYRLEMEEIHHTEKKDEPSGTAITLAEGIIKKSDLKEKWILNDDSDKKAIPIYSKREGKVPGTHIIKYSSPIDTIEIKHTAHSREGFAKGALLVAEWMMGKKGVLGMEDFLKF